MSCGRAQQYAVSPSTPARVEERNVLEEKLIFFVDRQRKGSSQEANLSLLVQSKDKHLSISCAYLLSSSSIWDMVDMGRIALSLEIHCASFWRAHLQKSSELCRYAAQSNSVPLSMHMPVNAMCIVSKETLLEEKNWYIL